MSLSSGCRLTGGGSASNRRTATSTLVLLLLALQQTRLYSIDRSQSGLHNNNKTLRLYRPGYRRVACAVGASIYTQRSHKVPPPSRRDQSFVPSKHPVSTAPFLPTNGMIKVNMRQSSYKPLQSRYPFSDDKPSVSIATYSILTCAGDTTGDCLKQLTERLRPALT
uniref:RxLR effector candidate protein n=1 Tax=Hyaloperonospora arabidopsidis (strain Emoy2) TaxID=559515 RepID=M4B743_HYAAE